MKQLKNVTTHLKVSGLRSKAECGKYLSGPYHAFTDDVPTCGKCFAHTQKLVEVAEEGGGREIPDEKWSK